MGALDPGDFPGIYRELSRRIPDLGIECSFVRNPSSGGFNAAYWGFSPLRLARDCEAYLQCQNELLCFRVSVPERADRSWVRNRFSEVVLRTAASLNFPAKRPDTFGWGKTMAVAVFDGDYRTRNRGEHTLDLDYAVETITKANAVLVAALSNCN